MSATRANVRGLRRRAFTLIELIAVVVIMAILVGIALPKFYDHSTAAKNAADRAAVGAINTALRMAYVEHRMNDAAASQWIDDVADIAAIMNHGMLPEGLTIASGKIVDQRGNTYTLTNETAAIAGTIIQD